MNTAIAWLANYLLWVMAGVAGIYWLWREDRGGKLQLAASAVVGLGVTLIFLVVLAHAHTDPRPFVQNPQLRPLIKHSPDNGFPSDHCCAAGLTATLVALRNRLWGAALAVAGLVLAAARVAAHVHHVQDVIAGLAAGTAAALIGTLLVVAGGRQLGMTEFAQRNQR